MGYRKTVVQGTSLLALGIGLAVGVGASPAVACSENVPGSATIAGNTSCVNWTGGGTFVVNSGVLLGNATIALSVSGPSGTLINNGTISASTFAIYNHSGSTINTLSNSGTINTSGSGIFNAGSIGTLINQGTITSQGTGLNNLGSIGTLINQGTISAFGAGIANNGSIGTITNAGVIKATYFAVYLASGSSLGTLTNTGVIAGGILNDSSQDLTIDGGSSTPGILTGSSGSLTAADKGLITNTQSNLVFGSGLQIVNDDIDVGSHTVVNTGATLGFFNPVTITGSYLETIGGELAFLVTNPTTYAYLSTTGDATVKNSTVLVSGSGLTAGETFTVVRADGTGTYTSDTATVTTTDGLGATITTVGNDLVVTLVSDSTNTYTVKGDDTGGNAAPVGRALDQILTDANGGDAAAQRFQTAVLDKIDALPLLQQGTAMKQLAPNQIIGGSLAINQVAAPTTSVIEQHELTLLSPDGSGSTGAAAGSASHDKAAWGELIGSFSNRSSSDGSGGYNSQNYGFVTGLDWQVSPQATLGVAASYVKGLTWGADDTSGSFTGIDSYQITGYGLYRFGAAFVDGQAGFGFNHYDQSRAINFLGQSAHADYNGEQYLAKAGAGYDVRLGAGTVLTPLVGLRYVAVVNNSYTESGSSADLSVKQMTVQALTQDLGLKLATKTQTPWGTLYPEGRIAWVHDYLNGDITSSATMAGVAFDSHTDRINPNGARLNLAATLDQANDMSLHAEYEGEFRSNYDSQTGLIKVSWGF